LLTTTFTPQVNKLGN